MPRITRISGSLAVVLIVYWAYALVAVPLIEPSADSKPNTIARRSNADGDDPGERERRQLRSLFPPDAWEVASAKTKVLKSDRAKLLLQSYDNLGGGRLKITPCTIVFDYDDPLATEEQRIRQSIILRSPQGAILQFDRPVDFKQPRDANLIGGQLIGEVVIYSDWKQPGPDDDLRIVTSNVRLDRQTISTADPVEFRWGPHFGGGQDMKIKLLPGIPRPGMGVSAMNVAGIEWFEMRHVERLHLDLGEQKGAKKPEATAAFSKNAELKPIRKPTSDSDLSFLSSGSTPVEISCRGAFRFNVVGRVATFSDDVHVVKPNPGGDSDELVGDELLIGFIERSTQKTQAMVARPGVRRAPSMDLKAERLEARGRPVVITAPSENVVARAKRIEYNLLTKTLSLDGDEPIYLRRGPNELRSRSATYQTAADPDRLGQVVALGPGSFHGQSPDEPEQQVEAVWQDELRIRPQDQFQVLSLIGGAELRSPGKGQLQAKKIFLWLDENPTAPKSARLKARALTASEDVRLGASQLSGKGIEQLEISFDDISGTPTAEQRDDAATGSLTPITPGEAAANPSTSQPIALLPPVTPGTANPQHFELMGRLVRARVQIGTSKQAMTYLLIENGVQITETQTEHPGEIPIVIRGDRLEATNATEPNARATVFGQPARFEGRGLTLDGANITIDRGEHRLTIDGPGRMNVLLDKDLDGRPLLAPSTLTILWKESMGFDGQTARFRREVNASTPGIPSRNEMTQFDLKTTEMDVRLQQPIDFSQQKTDRGPQDQRQIELIRCVGGVAMESRTFDARQQLVSHDQMKLTDLAVNRISGELNGGPGWINRVWRGSSDLTGVGPNGAPAAAPAKADQLSGLHVEYRGSITGNVLRHKVTFADQVRIGYAPVDSWDAVLPTADPNRLGEDGRIGSCDRLTVVQMPLPTGNGQSVELEAFGNAVVEGTTFRAVGHRITYAEVKDLFTIEGDGRSAAVLYRQLQIGAPSSTLPAQVIRYWRKANRTEIVGAQMLEVQLPDGKKR